MKLLMNTVTRLGILVDDLDYRLLRAALVIIFVSFGYQRWWDYEVQAFNTSAMGAAAILDVPTLSVSGAPPGSWEWWNGQRLCSYFSDFGIRRQEPSRHLAHVFPSSQARWLGRIRRWCSAND